MNVDKIRADVPTVRWIMAQRYGVELDDVAAEQLAVLYWVTARNQQRAIERGRIDSLSEFLCACALEDGLQPAGDGGAVTRARARPARGP